MAAKGSEVPIGRLVPHLVVHDASAAAEFYRKAFGATEIYRRRQSSRAGLYIHLRIADNVVIVTDNAAPGDPERLRRRSRISSPQMLGGTTVVLHFFVANVDTAFDRAVDAGAQPTALPFAAFWGDRYACVTDPYGHVWALATQLEFLTPDEIEARAPREHSSPATVIESCWLIEAAEINDLEKMKR